MTLHGIFTIYRKEMEDHFSSIRFLLIAALIVMIGVIIASMVGMSMQDELRGVAKPNFVFLLLFTSTGKLFSFTQFIGFLGPLIGIILGFDAVNRERAGRTLSKLVSQPIYRDAIINAKFLAGVTMIAIVMTSLVLIISGLGIRLIGVVPGADEVWRLLIYLVLSILYISFWLGAAILFSVVFRSTATSALASLAAWIFLSFFVGLGGSFLADAIAPMQQTADVAQATEAFLKNDRVQRIASLLAPGCDFDDPRSAPEDAALLYPDGAAGEALPLPFPEPAPAYAERGHRCTLSDIAYRHHLRLFRDLLPGLHAPGDPVDVVGRSGSR
jgi:ABC-2 type transport system permease protein